MWVAYARTVLGQHLARPNDGPEVGPGVLEQFEGLLDDWDTTAQRGTEFVWTADLDPDTLELLARSFFDLVAVLAHEAANRGFPISPPEGDEFYWALVETMLDSLTAAGGAHAGAAADLAARWPGRKVDES
jgi:hypothetical protein